MMGEDEEMTRQSVAQFSERDAEALPAYEEFLNGVREVLQPLLEAGPPQLAGNVNDKLASLKSVSQLARVGWKRRESLVPLYELVTGPASHILDRWFDSEVLKTTLACPWPPPPPQSPPPPHPLRARQATR